MNTDCLLYFSSRCKPSVELLSYIEKNGIADRFLLINVDNPKFQIPPFVDRVPLLYRRSDRSVIVEDALETFIKTFGQPVPPVEQQYNVNCYNEVVGGDNYGFIDESVNKQVYSSGHAYDYISNADSVSNTADSVNGSLASENVNKGSRFDENSYKEYLMKRDMDISQIFSRQKRA